MYTYNLNTPFRSCFHLVIMSSMTLTETRKSQSKDRIRNSIGQKLIGTRFWSLNFAEEGATAPLKVPPKLDRAESTSAHPLLWISGSLAINWSLCKITIVNPLGKEHMNFQETKTKIYSVYIIPAVNTQNHSHDLIHKIKNEGGRKKKTTPKKTSLVMLSLEVISLKQQHNHENIMIHHKKNEWFKEILSRFKMIIEIDRSIYDYYLWIKGNLKSIQKENPRT